MCAPLPPGVGGGTVWWKIAGTVVLAMADTTSGEVSLMDRMKSILKEISVINNIPLCGIFNFCFVYHINHYKSFLTFRVMYLMGNQGRDLQTKAL